MLTNEAKIILQVVRNIFKQIFYNYTRIPLSHNQGQMFAASRQQSNI